MLTLLVMMKLCEQGCSHGVRLLMFLMNGYHYIVKESNMQPAFRTAGQSMSIAWHPQSIGVSKMLLYNKPFDPFTMSVGQIIMSSSLYLCLLSYYLAIRASPIL